MERFEIVFTTHAERRMEERFISRRDVEAGLVEEGWEEAYDDRLKVSHRINGKAIEVVFKPEERCKKLLVITVYWC